MANSKAIFFDQLMKVFPIELERMSSDERDELIEVSRNSIFDLEGPRHISRTPPPKELWCHRRLFLPCAAIYRSHDALLDIQVYVRRFPYRGTRVSPATHLQHCIESYLQEIYILRQRLIDFLNCLEKDYTGTPQGDALARINQPLCKTLKGSLRSIIEARKQHVHGGGYDDEKLKRVGTLELLTRHGWKGDTDREKLARTMIRCLYQNTYKEERRRWVKLVHNTNVTLEKFQERYFELLSAIVFGPEGDLIFPPVAEKYSD